MQLDVVIVVSCTRTTCLVAFISENYTINCHLNLL